MTSPNKVFVKLKFTSIPQTWTVQIAPAVTTSVVVIGNDPTNTLPTGFDQWSAFFQRYTVLASKIKLNLFTAGSAASTTFNPVRVSLLPSDQVIAGGSGLSQAFQDRAGYSMPSVKTGHLSNINDRSTLQLKHFVRTKKLYPTKDVEDELLFSGYTGSGGHTLSSPTNTWNWVMVTEALSTSTSQPAVYGYYECTFYMMFSDPVTLADS